MVNLRYFWPDVSQILLSSYPFSYPNVYSLDFDGSNDFVSFAAAVLNPNLDFTFECWVKLDTGGQMPFFSSSTDGSHYWIFINQTSPNAVTFQYDTGGGGQFVSAAVPLSTGVWTHLALSRSGNSWQWYINGVASGGVTTDSSNTLDQNTAPLIAAYSSLFWDGKIDEVRIWDVARTAGQIAANISRNVVPADEPNLTGYWRFEEGSGTTATDSAGANNGTLTNGPTYSTDKPY